MGHLRPLDLLTIALYAAVMLLIAWGYSRRQSAEDYFVAGRRARSWVVGLSMIAALFSTVSFLGYPGELITYGPGYAWSMLHAPITFAIVGFLIIPHIMKHRVTSGYELLEHRFGPAVRKAASLLFVALRLLWMAFVLALCGGAVSVVTEIPLPYVLIGVGLITTVSTSFGGIRTVLLTDVIQFIIHLGGGLLVIAYVAYRCGGVDWMFHWDRAAITQLHWPEVKFFSLDPSNRVTLVGAVVSFSLWWICTATSDQMMIQRYLCTRDVKSARRSFLHCMIGDTGIALMMWGISAALLAYFLRFRNELPDPSVPLSNQADRLFPHFIATALPDGIRGLLVAALFADAMQSLSSGISALGTVLVVDFRKVFAPDIPPRRPGDQQADDRRLLRRAKAVGIGVGAVAVSLTYVVAFVPGRNVMDTTYRLSNFLIIPMFVVFALAFFVPFASRAGAWTAMGVGLTSGLLFSYWKQIVGAFTPVGEFSVILIMPVSLACSFTAGVLMSAVSAATSSRAARSPDAGALQEPGRPLANNT